MTGNSQYGSFARQVVTRLALLVIALGCVQYWIIDGLLPALTVSSGSMAPTVLGPHLLLSCTDCGFHFPAEPPDPSRVYQLACPQCRGAVAGDVEDVHRGNRLLVNRAAYLLEPPQRGDVVLLHCAQAGGITGPCIKRILGLPGEQLELRQGNVLVNGAFAQKSLDQWRSVRILVHDDRFRPAESSPSKYFWDPVSRESSDWKHTASGWERPAATDQGGQPDWLTFRSIEGDLENPIVWDDLPYNTNESRQLNAVADGSIAVTTRLSGQGYFLIQGLADGETAVAEYELGSKSVSLVVGDKEVARQPLATAGHPIAWELAIIDGQVTIVAEGQLVLTWHFLRPENESHEPEPVAWAVGVRGAVDSQIEQLQTFRDIYYAPAAGRPTGRQLSDREYFVLGDNPAASEDSRHWAADSVTAAQILGKPRIIGRSRQ